MHDELNLSMFRAYDIRTPSSLLTVELAQRLGNAEAKYFREDLEASIAQCVQRFGASGEYQG